MRRGVWDVYIAARVEGDANQFYINKNLLLLNTNMRDPGGRACVLFILRNWSLAKLIRLRCYSLLYYLISPVPVYSLPLILIQPPCIGVVP